MNRGTSEQAVMVPVGQIRPDPDQPRRVFEPGPLQELALSIRQDGLQQYPVVRADPSNPDAFMLVSGERRWRASQLAGLDAIPCYVRDVDPERAFELAIIENDLREDLTPLDRAFAYRRLMDRGWSLDDVAVRMKKTRAFVEFYVRLTNLRPEYQDALRRGILTSPQACDLARVPHERQPQVFAMYRRGADPNDVARVITAMLEVDQQTELVPPDEAKTAGAKDRFGKMLTGIASQIGRCYSRADLDLLGWVTDGSIDKNLILVGLLIKQLGQVQNTLRQAKARREVRQPERREEIA